MVAYYGAGHPMFRISGRVQNGGSGAASYMTFSTNTGGSLTEKVWINSAGNVGVGGSTPNGKLEVTSGNSDGIVFFQQGDNTNSIQSYIDGQWSNRTTYAGGCCNSLLIQPDVGNLGVRTNAPGVAFQVGNAADGTTASANAWNINSDVRWKKDISSITNGLELATALQGVNYTWKGNNKKDFGFIAQEVEKVLPLAVHNDDKGYKAVDYARITSVLVEAIKELKKQNDELKFANENLKTENTKQEKRLQIIEQKVSAIQGTNIQTKK